MHTLSSPWTSCMDLQGGNGYTTPLKKWQGEACFYQQLLMQLWLGAHSAATLKKISHLSSGDTHNDKKHAQPVREAEYVRDTDETPTHQTRSKSKGKWLSTAASASHLPGERWMHSWTCLPLLIISFHNIRPLSFHKYETGPVSLEKTFAANILSS